MAVFTKKEFCEQYGFKTKHISTFVERRKLILLGDGCIDDKDPRNALFILRAKEKREPEIPIIETEEVIVNIKPKQPVVKKQASTKTIDEENGEVSETTQLVVLDKKKAVLDIKKKQADLEKVLLSNAKAKGEVIPFGLMLPIIRQNNQSLTTSFKNAADELILEFAKQANLDIEKVAHLKKTLVEKINVAVKNGTEASIKNVTIILNDYKLSIK